MGCNESKSQGQPIPKLHTQNYNNNKVHNEAQMLQHRLGNQFPISHQAIVFEEDFEANSKQTPKKASERSPKLRQTNSRVMEERQLYPTNNNAKIDITNYSTLIQAIKSEITQNGFYNSIFDIVHLEEILQFVRSSYTNSQNQYYAISIILHFLRSCGQIAQGQMLLKVNSFEAAVTSLAARWQMLKVKISNDNKNSLKMLNYIIPKKTNEQRGQGQCYLDLKFDANLSESAKMLQLVREFVKSQQSAFCFFTNYLLQCCQNLQAEGKNVTQICMILQEHCQLVCNQIIKENGKEAKRNAEDEAFNVHKNFKAKLPSQQKKYYQFEQQSVISKQDQLQAYIKSVLCETKTFYKKLLDFLQNLCNQQDYAFQCYQMKNDEQNVFEIKLTTLTGVQLEKYKSEQLIENQPMAKFIEKELIHQKQQRKQIYEFMSGKIEFKASCMLQAKCLFQNIVQLNQCAERIKIQIEKNRYTLIQIKNCLNLKSLRWLSIVFGIDSFKIQIKLLMDLNLAQFIISDYLHQIFQSKMSTTLTALYLLNKSLTHKFMQRIYPKIVYEIYENNQEFIQKKSIPKQLKQLLGSWKVALAADHLGDDFSQLQADGCLFQLKNQFQALKAAKLQIKIPDNLIKLYNKIRYKSVQKQTQSCQLELQLFKAYITKEQSQPKSKQASEQLQSKILAYSNCLYISAENCINRKNYTKVEELVKQYMEITVEFGHLVSLQSVKMKKFLALCEYSRNNFNEALKIFKQCIQLINKSGQQSMKVEKLRIQTQLALIYKDQGNTIKALSIFNDILQEIYAKALKQDALQCTVLKSIAGVLIKNNQYEDSLVYLSKALKVSERISGKGSLQSIEVIVLIAQVKEMQGLFQDALQQYKTCQKIIKIRKNEDQFMICEILEHMAKVYNQLLLYQQAEPILVKCLSLVQKQKGPNSTEYGEMALAIGKLYLNLQKYQLALKYLLKALSIREKTHGKETVKSLDVLQEIVQVYRSMRKYKDEQHYMNKVNNILKLQKQKCNISYLNTYNNIADKSQNRGNYAVALDYYQKSINILQKLNKKGSLEAVGIHQSIANIYREQQHYSAASEHYQNCLKILQAVKGKNSIERAEVICEIGNLYELQGKEQNALDYYLQCFNLCIRYKVKYRVYAICCYRLGKLCLKNGEEKDAVKYWKECLPIYEKMLANQTQQIKQKLIELENLPLPFDK